MSDYTQTTDFSDKDDLLTGDPEKLILGADFDVEFAAIASAIATKFDVSDEASALEAQTGTASDKLITPRRIESWAAQNLGLVKDLSDIASDPGVDAIPFYDKTDDTLKFLTLGDNLATDGTTLNVVGDTLPAATEVVITAAQLADCHNTPIVVIVAGGANIVAYDVKTVALATGSTGTAPFNISSIPLTYGDASGQAFCEDLYLELDTLTVAAQISFNAVKGDLENKAIVFTNADPLVVPGGLSALTITNGGTGYSVNDVLTVNFVDDEILLTVTQVGGGGVIQAVNITEPGMTAYVDVDFDTTGGGGSGFLFDITAVDHSLSDYTLRIKTSYGVLDWNA